MNHMTAAIKTYVCNVVRGAPVVVINNGSFSLELCETPIEYANKRPVFQLAKLKI